MVVAYLQKGETNLQNCFNYRVDSNICAPVLYLLMLVKDVFCDIAGSEAGVSR